MTTPPLKIGDLVHYKGAGASVLDYGPGRIVNIDGDVVRVEVMVGGPVPGNKNVKKGERFYFEASNLEHAHPKRGTG